MSVSRKQFIEEARRWLGTPFRHQGRDSTGLDCIGLVIVSAQSLGLTEFDYLNYNETPDPILMEKLLSEHLHKIPLMLAREADIYYMAFAGEPRHVAVVTDVGIIHAFKGAGKVAEHVVDDRWTRRILRAYRIPGVI